MPETNKNNQAQRIYDDLRRRILRSELVKGDRLIETGIAREYNASRIHVKDAFRLLESEFLVRHIPQRGFVVVGVCDDTINEIAQIRQALEKVVVRKIIETAGDEDIELFEKIAKRFEVFVKNDMIEDSMKELDYFYEKMYSLSSYKRITGILNQYSDYIILIRQLTVTSRESLTEGIQNLYNLVAAIKGRNIKEAEYQLELRHSNLVGRRYDK